MSYLPLGCQLLISALLIGAAVQDVRSRTISNGWPATILILFVFAYALGALQGPLASHLLHFALALAIGMLLFALGWFGGGDAKLYAVVALWFSLGTGLYLFVSVALAGVCLAFIHILFRMFQSKQTRRRAIREGKIAYGVAIAAGAILSLPQVIV